MDSTAGSADRVRRKVKVVVGKSKGLGVLTPETKDRNADRDRGKAKLSKQKLKGSGDGVRTSLKDEKPKGKGRDTNNISKRSSDDVRVVKPTRKQQSRGYDNDTASNGIRNEESTNSRGWGRRDLKTKSGDQKPNFKVKVHERRVEGRVHERNVRKFDPKPNFKVKPTLKFKGTESLHKRSFGGQTEGADKRKRTGASVFGNRTSKTADKMRAPLLGRTERGKYSIDSATKSRNSKFGSRKSLTRDSELTEGPPKKKKRGIRLDRHDTSNKRLDDDRAKNENQENKISTEGNEGEMSKNAQFRAIIPSSSILSFVEDNMLGRRREIEFKRAGYNIELPSPLDNLPFSTNSERERIEVPVFRNKLEFYAAAKISSSIPAPELPEIAFAGRSNVGKSSLLNSLTRQWGAVRTSDKPGLTQTINFFKLGPKMSLVDLPGYGFAYAKDEVKESWEELVKEYVSTRASLKRVCLLVDTKWGLKPRDHELIELMERSETKYQIVLTKTDLVFPVDVARRAMQIEESLRAKKSAVQPLMMVSSKTGGGIRSLRTALINILKLAKR